MIKQEKFENYMNNTLAPWVLRVVMSAHIGLAAIILLSCIK